MKRLIINKLLKWKQSKRRKPLILYGARQVGKTYILREFGKSYFPNSLYINFERQVEYKQFFQTTKDVNRIIENLSIASGVKITPETLIIFDEIQECEEALNTLKYFNEDASEYCVCCAGSLLGLKLSHGFPVGKVDFMELGPLTFEEFLLAEEETDPLPQEGNDNISSNNISTDDGSNNHILYNYINNIKDIEQIPDFFFNQLVEKLKTYYITGGMPEVVDTWINERNIESVEEILFNILFSYQNDFGKHNIKYDVPKIEQIYNSIPSQLSRENKKFLYSAVKTGARAREYENALNFLNSIYVVKKVYRVSKPILPLSAYDDLSAFKIYMNDVGLLRKLSNLSPAAFSEKNRLFVEFKGALAENFVLQSIYRCFEGHPRYWSDTINNNSYEVDFIVQYENTIIPIEVKAGENIKSASIKNYCKLYNQETPLIVRLSLKNLSLDGNILNVPLFLVDKLPDLIKMGLQKVSEDKE